MAKRRKRFHVALEIGTPGFAGPEKCVPKYGLGHWLRSGRLTLKIWFKRGLLPGWFGRWLRCLAASGSGNRQRPRPPAVPPG